MGKQQPPSPRRSDFDSELGEVVELYRASTHRSILRLDRQFQISTDPHHEQLAGDWYAYFRRLRTTDAAGAMLSLMRAAEHTLIRLMLSCGQCTFATSAELDSFLREQVGGIHQADREWIHAQYRRLAGASGEMVENGFIREFPTQEASTLLAAAEKRYQALVKAVQNAMT